MNGRTGLACALSLVVVSACSTYNRVRGGEVTASEVGEAGRWSAALAPPPTLAGSLSITGWAAMVRDSTGGGTLVTLSLADAPVGSLARWSVSRGQCGADQGVFGAAGAYEPVRIDSAGRARATARVALRTPTTGHYFVSVRGPVASGETTVACGNLTAPVK